MGVIRLAAGHGPEYGEGAGGESQEISQSFARLGKGRQYMQSEEEPRRKEIQRTEIL